MVVELWALVVLGATLVAAAVTDVRAGKIRNAVTYPAIAVGFIGHTLMGGLTGTDGYMGLTDALIGFAVGFLPMLVAWRAGGIGGGDAKLIGAVGALAGWRFTMAAMLYSFAIAAVMAFVVMIRKRVVRRTLGRVFRFMYLAFTPNRPADPGTPDSPKVPIGLAFCIGSAVALVEALIGSPQACKVILGL